MTNEDPPPGPVRRELRTGRLEAFSDGVFAIAITLLVLDIAVPAGAEAHLLRSIIDLWPSYLAYVVSVSTIGALWLGHNAVTEYLERTDVVFGRLNLLLLLVIAFLPFPTRLFAEFIGKESPERVAATIYGLTLLLASTLLLVLWRHSLRRQLVRPDAADEEILVSRHGGEPHGGRGGGYRPAGLAGVPRIAAAISDAQPQDRETPAPPCP
jgi:uncharacterized membrane protein